MCHHTDPDPRTLTDAIARELLEEGEYVEDEDLEPGEREPSFLNESRETDVDLMTDGGSED